MSLLLVTTAFLSSTAAGESPLGCPDEYPWGASAGGVTYCCDNLPPANTRCRVEPHPEPLPDLHHLDTTPWCSDPEYPWGVSYGDVTFCCDNLPPANTRCRVEPHPEPLPDPRH